MDKENLEKLMEIITGAVDYFRINYIDKLKKYKEKERDENYYELMGSVHIYSHLDTDGLSAAAALSLALKREGIGYQVTILKQLEEQFFPEIIESIQDNNQFLIFSDFGSGQLNLFKKFIKSKNYIILDHHESLKDDSDKLIEITGYHANPYFAGVNGSNEISGAGMAYLFAEILNPKNKKISYIPIIGAIGDVQNQGSQKSFLGINEIFLKTAQDEGLVTVETEPSISRSKDLTYGLAYTLPVEINEFYRDKRAAEVFLKRIGIKTKTELRDERKLADLSASEKQKLTSELIQLAITQPNFDTEDIDKMIGANYLITPFKDYIELYDAKDVSKMLNACGRLGQPSVGIAVLMMKDDKSIKKAIAIMKEYSKIQRDGMNWISDNKKIHDMDGILYFYGEDQIHENIIGTICSMQMYNNKNKSKPIIGYANSDKGFYKLSARCSKKLVSKGVNLSTAIRVACVKLNIEEKGGGHPPASGARIPVEKMDDFLKKLNKIVLEQKDKNKNKNNKKTKGLDEFGL